MRVLVTGASGGLAVMRDYWVIFVDVAQEQFLVDRSCHVRQQSLPAHRCSTSAWEVGLEEYGSLYGGMQGEECRQGSA